MFFSNFNMLSPVFFFFCSIQTVSCQSEVRRRRDFTGRPKVHNELLRQHCLHLPIALRSLLHGQWNVDSCSSLSTVCVMFDGVRIPLQHPRCSHNVLPKLSRSPVYDSEEKRLRYAKSWRVSATLVRGIHKRVVVSSAACHFADSNTACT